MKIIFGQEEAGFSFSLGNDRLKPMVLRTAQNSEFEAILNAVASYYDYSHEQLLGPRRSAGLAWARMVGMCFSRLITNRTLQEVGDFWGNRDHGTVIHAVKRVSFDMETALTSSDGREARGLYDSLRMQIGELREERRKLVIKMRKGALK